MRHMSFLTSFEQQPCSACFAEVNSTFTGQSDPYFLGLIPVLSIFDELEGGEQTFA